MNRLAMVSLRKALVISSLLLVSVLGNYSISPAAVSGACVNCHTMHNSQGGQPMAYSYSGGSFVADETANPSLLITDCIGCHTATDGTTWKDASTGAPIVYNTSAPTYGATSDGGTTYQGLAAGNFYWVEAGDDANGHNILSDDAYLDEAPGDKSGCASNNACHVNFHLTYTGVGALNGRAACQGCHMVSGDGSSLSVTAFHHKDDTGPVIDTADEGWYRFLAGHYNADGHGVSGIEDPDWEHSPTSAVHNEYYGYDGDKTAEQILASSDSMTGFCVGCHGDFHKQDATVAGSSPWLRHPSDAPLPNSGEYTGYTVYNPLVPVARPSLSTVSSTVTPGTDMVMCLSCHRAHASPYYKMVRWDYKSSSLSTALTGCSVCHTSKN